MGGGLRQSMKFSDVKRLPILVPTKDEQQTIAAFLDQETAKIDALIAEQQRLIGVN
jgi:type I restriction enzyme S subunit